MTDTVSAVTEATKAETFNFAEAVLDRDYPEITVPVYLNEKKVRELVELMREREPLEIKAAKSQTPPVEIAKRLGQIETRVEEITEELKKEEYLVSLRGIAPEDHNDLIAKANEKFPIDYTEAPNPITGATVKTEVENEDRDDYLVSLVRQAHLVSVTAPNGAVDSDFKGEENVAKVQKTFARLPFIARYKIDEAIREATIQVDFYREIVDEVF